MIDLKHYQAAMAALPPEILEAEVNAETHNVTEVTVSKDTANVESARQTALYLRVSGEKTGYLYTQNLSEDAQAAIRTAYENSLSSEADGADAMPDRSETVCYRDAAAESSAHALREIADGLKSKLEGRLAEKGVDAELHVRLKAETYGQHTVNSHGLDAGFTAPIYIASFTASTKEGDSARTELAAADPAQFDPEVIAQTLADHLRWSKDPESRFVAGDYPVIFSEEAAYNLLHAASQAFSALKYLENGSQLAGRLGERIGPDCLTIRDSVDFGGKGFPMYCDSEGCPGRDVTLVENGVFVGLMHNCRTAKAMGQENTGNAGRRPTMCGSSATEVLITPKNICIEPGSSTLEEMMRHMGDGILITEYLDVFHSMDLSSGNFNAPCFGVRIKDGKEAGNLTALTLSGNLLKFLNGIQEVGGSRMLRPMDYLENFGVAACALRVDSLNISGEE